MANAAAREADEWFGSGIIRPTASASMALWIWKRSSKPLTGSRIGERCVDALIGRKVESGVARRRGTSLWQSSWQSRRCNAQGW